MAGQVTADGLPCGSVYTDAEAGEMAIEVGKWVAHKDRPLQRMAVEHDNGDGTVVCIIPGKKSVRKTFPKSELVEVNAGPMRVKF